MRKRTRSALALAFVGTLLGASLAFCRDTPAQEPKDPVYELHFVPVADVPWQVMWYFGDKPTMLYKSLHSQRLEEWLADLPKDTLIEYRPSSFPLVAEKIYHPNSDAHAFGRYCQSKGIRFTDGFPTF